MNTFIILTFLIVLLIIELIYFKIADKYNIIDKPNHRSSHTQITIRGGGIIFSLSIFIGTGFYGLQYPYFLLGLFLISLISFIDDINPIANKSRIIFHLIAVSLLFYQLKIYWLSYYLIAASFVFVIGTINAVNFMDGINGITGGYTLLTILTLCFINNHVSVFVDNTYLIVLILSLLVFNFFNFRIKAKCFAGDVGSVSIAFIIIFFLLQLIIKTNNLNYLLLLSMYGLDTVTTIAFRLCKKENIFKAHRAHFYQYLANQKNIPHLVVAVIYIISQGIINFFVINFSNLSLFNMLLIFVAGTCFFISIRVYFEGIKRFFEHQ